MKLQPVPRFNNGWLALAMSLCLALTRAVLIWGVVTLDIWIAPNAPHGLITGLVMGVLLSADYLWRHPHK